MHSNIILGYQSWASDDPDNGQYGPAFMSPSNNNYNWRDGDSGSHAHPICQITKSMAYLIVKSIQLTSSLLLYIAVDSYLYCHGHRALLMFTIQVESF